MLDQAHSEQSAFFAAVKVWYEAVNASGSLGRLRTKSWDRFLELGLPERRDEVFRYIRPHRLYGRALQCAEASAALKSEDLTPYHYPECKGACLVLVDGKYAPELSQRKAIPEQLVVATLDKAIRTYSTFLNNHWLKTLKDEKDPFVALNGAVHSEGLFLYLAPNIVIEQPIQVLNIVTAASTDRALHPRVNIFAGKQSELTLAIKTVELGSNGYLLNSVVDAVVDEGAHVKVVADNRNLSPDVWHLEALRGQLKGNSSLKSTAVTEGAFVQRSDYRVAIHGENAETELSGLALLDEKREAHVHVLVDHQAPNCRSDQLFKNVLTDISRASFEGKILVQQAAQKTEAYQLNNNLLLSDKANADSKPNLEIFADDVKASHGATVGQLDTEQMFYLRTRGYDKHEAQNLLIRGFCQDVTDRLRLPSLADEVSDRARNFLA